MKYNVFFKINKLDKSYKVNQRYINNNIPIAFKRILLNEDHIKNVFKSYLKKKYNIYEDDIFFDNETLVTQLDNVLVSNKVRPWAENNNGTIFISNWDNMKKEELISVLIHEAIHNLIKIKRVTRFSQYKDLGCKDEHICMDILGDNIYEYI